VSYVYFISESTGRRVKIGRSIDPLKRLRALQTGSPEKLWLVGALRESHITEQTVHETFRFFVRTGSGSGSP